MKRLSNIFRVLSVATVVMIAACTSDVDEISNGASSPIVNVELNAALAKQGFSLDSDGLLIINDMVRNTTHLDLSGEGITHTTGLNLFSSLQSIDLSDNEFGSTIELKYIPSTVTTIDLSGNDEISTYSNLASTYSKIILPYSAKWDMYDILSYVVANEGVEVEYATADGEGTEIYTTRREIPDADLRALLQSLYPSIFDVDVVDLTYSMAASERNVALIMESEVENLEGVEYAICRTEYGSTSGSSIATVLRGSTDNPYTWSANGLSGSIASLTMRGVNSLSDLDLSSATALKYLDIEGNETVENLTLPSGFVGSSVSSTSIFTSALRVVDCESLTSIDGLNSAGGFGRLELRQLDNLESLSLANITMIHTIIMEDLPQAEVTMPSHLSKYADGWGAESSRFSVVVALSTEIAQQSDVQRFIQYQSENFQLLDFTNYYITNL